MNPEVLALSVERKELNRSVARERRAWEHTRWPDRRPCGDIRPWETRCFLKGINVARLLDISKWIGHDVYAKCPIRLVNLF